MTMWSPAENTFDSVSCRGRLVNHRRHAPSTGQDAHTAFACANRLVVVAIDVEQR